ncbi:universal stress protein [Rhizobium sp. 18055]|uniref:universal stress protein n=1 Tax=Rhizobium sp. 18055 TaxID=2681403 RepID=UPI0013582CBF|nr:universal stress protein [Rhizobium sp. 18055]
MTMKSILAILSSTGFEGDLQSAIAFCAARKAHLTCLVVSLGQPPVFSEYSAVSTIWIDQRQREIDELSQKAGKIRTQLSKSDLSYEVQDLYTEFAWADDDIAQRALYVDLVLIGREAARDEELRKRILDGALFQSPTPIIINRSELELAPHAKSIILAWDSSNEAPRAARLSIDVLKHAETVYVTMVDPVARMAANGEEPGADVAAYLARHGVRVQVDRIASGGRQADEILRQHALDVSADLIVMGAYNHPRWRQSLFGGTTRGMIEDSRMPVMLAH